MYNVVVKKVHVRYLISWWVSCISYCHCCRFVKDFSPSFYLYYGCCSVRFPVSAFSLLFVLWASAWNKDWLIYWFFICGCKINSCVAKLGVKPTFELPRNTLKSKQQRMWKRKWNEATTIKIRNFRVSSDAQSANGAIIVARWAVMQDQAERYVQSLFAWLLV